MDKLSEIEFGVRFRKEFLQDPNSELHCVVASKWKSYGEENKVIENSILFSNSSIESFIYLI